MATAPGKLNLVFRVGKLRADGYHEVFSVYQAVNLRERVSLSLSEEFAISVGGTLSKQQLESVPRDATNLVYRAASLIEKKFPGHFPPLSRIRFNIEKSIPVLGGMAGGSADAAATLTALNNLWNLNICAEDLALLAAQLGADVPFSLLGGTALGTSAGEVLQAVRSAVFHFVLIFSEAGLSTPVVFSVLDKLRVPQDTSGSSQRNELRGEELDSLKQALLSGEPAQLANYLENDLQLAAVKLLPELEGVMRLGLSLGAVHAQVSGSGPTVFLLAENAAHAKALEGELLERGYSALACMGNAPGATLE